jgi:uncharacterized protein YeeX (DUF496 family)
MNNGITLKDVRQEAFDAIRQLKAKEMDVQTARTIREMLQVVVDTAKTQIEFLKVIPDTIKDEMSADDVKAIAGTLRDTDAELDTSLAKIERRRMFP